MAGYLHPGQTPFLPETGVSSICDVHVSTYRSQSYYILCVSPSLKKYIDGRPLMYVPNFHNQAHYFSEHTEIISPYEFTHLRVCRPRIMDRKLCSYSPYRQIWASTLAAVRGGMAVYQHGCYCRYSCISKQQSMRICVHSLYLVSTTCLFHLSLPRAHFLIFLASSTLPAPSAPTV